MISRSHASLLAELGTRAASEGLSAPRVTLAKLPPPAGERLQLFLQQGHHGDMDWMEQRVAERASPDALWPEARTALVFAQPYGQGMDPLQRLHNHSAGMISTYALHRDYHDLFKGKLKRLAQWFHHASKADAKIFVDTAPMMEKPLAAQAGVGWQGKHTNLVSRDLGSWFFIGTVLTNAELPVDDAESDHCGSCRACLDVCPTKAFPAPYQLDARRCISYLTIEHKGHIAREFREAMGNRIYGCDDCLAVCPWNKFAQVSQEAKLKAREDLVEPALAMLLALDDAAFRKLFAASPVKRAGRDRFVRNCLIAAGNSGDSKLLPLVMRLLEDASPLVRAMAVWALGKLADQAEFEAHKARCMGGEPDYAVQAEWNHA